MFGFNIALVLQQMNTHLSNIKVGLEHNINHRMKHILLYLEHVKFHIFSNTKYDENRKVRVELNFKKHNISFLI